VVASASCGGERQLWWRAPVVVASASCGGERHL
jgi:hypothetical protein